MGEEVYGVRRPILEEIYGSFDGFQPVAEPLSQVASQLEALGEFRLRDAVEEDPSFLQLIPYVALTCQGKVLLMERLSGGGEKRLHGLCSIGVGGHVNPEPPGSDPLLIRGLKREVAEEVEYQVRESDQPQLLGFLRDDSNPVGRVHFGLACVLEIPDPVEIREVDRIEGRWISFGDLGQYEASMETWSRFFWPVINSHLEMQL